MPLNWLLILALAIFFYRKKARQKKGLVIAATILFFIFTNPALFRATTLAWQTSPDKKVHEGKYSAGILLTGMTMADKHHRQYFGGTSDRFLQTARLYHTGVIQHILISGGSGSLDQDQPREADFLRRELIALNVPDSLIMVENQSRNTYESAVAARPLLAAKGWQPPYLLVTSAIHQPRSLAVFRKVGITVEPHPANYDVIESRMRLGDFKPSLMVLHQWQFLLKEMVGMLVYKMTGKA